MALCSWNSNGKKNLLKNDQLSSASPVFVGTCTDNSFHETVCSHRLSSSFCLSLPLRFPPFLLLYILLVTSDGFTTRQAKSDLLYSVRNHVLFPFHFLTFIFFFTTFVILLSNFDFFLSYFGGNMISPCKSVEFCLRFSAR